MATYLPGRRIPGIRVNPDSVELEVVTAWATTAAGIGSAIRSAVAPLVAGRRVDITIVDIELPSDQAAAEQVTAPPELPAAPQRPELPAAPIYSTVVPPER